MDDLDTMDSGAGEPAAAEPARAVSGAPACRAGASQAGSLGQALPLVSLCTPEHARRCMPPPLAAEDAEAVDQPPAK